MSEPKGSEALRALLAQEPYEELTYEPPAEELDDDLLEGNEEANVVVANGKATATFRAKRTGVQGLLAAVLIAIGGVFTSLQVDADIDWRLVGLAVGQAVLTAFISFLHNDPTP